MLPINHYSTVSLDLSVSKTIIHIGMPRAASTYFQKVVFPKIEGITFLGIDTAHYGHTFQKIMYQDDSAFNLEEIRKELDTLCGKTTLISNEVFVGQSRFMSSSNRTRTADRFRLLFPDAEILIVLRNQASLIQSLYAIGVYAGYTGSENDYVKFTESSAHNPSTPENYPSLEEGEATGQYFYTELIKTYTDRFQKTHVVLFEDFKDNPKRFLSELSDKLELKFDEIQDLKKVNSSLSKLQIRLLRTLNLWKPLLQSTQFGRYIFNVKIRFIEHTLKGKTPFRLDKGLRDKLKNHYRQDNQKLVHDLPEINESRNFEKFYCD